MQRDTRPTGACNEEFENEEFETAPYRDRDLTVDEVKSILEHRLEHHGNERLRVGKVEEKDDDVIVAEMETIDGSVVESYAVDRHTGRMQRSK